MNEIEKLVTSNSSFKNTAPSSPTALGIKQTKNTTYKVLLTGMPGVEHTKLLAVPGSKPSKEMIPSNEAINTISGREDDVAKVLLDILSGRNNKTQTKNGQSIYHVDGANTKDPAHQNSWDKLKADYPNLVGRYVEIVKNEAIDSELCDGVAYKN